MTPDTRDVFDGVTGLVRRNAQPGDTLLVYPYYPIFYSSTGLRAPTFTFNHFVDVTPDWIVERDLAAMRSAPPAFIVFLEEDKDDVEVNDRVFRGGRPSQSRKLAALIRDMTQHYRLLGAFRTPGKQCDLKVWRRP